MYIRENSEEEKIVVAVVLCLGSGFAFRLFRRAGGQHLDELLAIDAVLVIDDHLGEGVVDFLAGELVAPGHESVSQVVTVNEA